MVSELERLGFADEQRIYLSFVDTTSTNICGIGSIVPDARPDLGLNWNNVGPSYSRLDARVGCWDGVVAAHELMHNMGGVQPGAPHATPGYHCVDEYDVMCYSEVNQRLNLPPMEIVCGDPARDWTRLDCGHDSYFSTDPLPGSYLSNNWNAANNQFLTNAPAPPVVQTPQPTVDTSQPPPPPPPPTKHKNKHKKHSKKKH